MDSYRMVAINVETIVVAEVLVWSEKVAIAEWSLALQEVISLP